MLTWLVKLIEYTVLVRLGVDGILLVALPISGMEGGQAERKTWERPKELHLELNDIQETARKRADDEMECQDSKMMARCRAKMC